MCPGGSRLRIGSTLETGQPSHVVMFTVFRINKDLVDLRFVHICGLRQSHRPTPLKGGSFGVINRYKVGIIVPIVPLVSDMFYTAYRFIMVKC